MAPRSSRASHSPDDVRGVVDENLRVVYRLLLAIEDVRGGNHRCGKSDRIDLHAVAGAERPIPFTLKRRARIDEREIDVEEHRPRRRSSLIRTGDDDRGAVDVERLASGGVYVFKGDSVEQRRKPEIVVEPQPEELRSLQKRGDGAVRFEEPRYRSDQILLAIGELVWRQPSAAIRRISSSIEATARSTFAGFTPARTMSGPSTTFASNELNT